METLAVVRPYVAFAIIRGKMLLQYRAAAIAGFGCQAFWGLIRVMVFTAFFHSTTSPQPMTLSETITYVWLGQGMFAMMPWFRDAELRMMIRTGNVAYELVRPLDLYSVWFARSVASRLAPTLLRAVPMFVVAGLFLGLQPPPSIAAAIAWGVATVGALLLGSALAVLVAISMMWTIAGEGVDQLATISAIVLSGMIVPLAFFPDWAQDILYWLPYRGLIDAPFRLYMGHLPVSALGETVTHQLLWTAIFVLSGRWMMSCGLRKLVVQGG